MRVLIVEDSQTLAEALSQSLQSEGYACDTAADGVSALKFLASYRYDAIILDLMLPRLDGFGVLRALGREAHAAPVLVLSARELLDDRVRAFDFYRRFTVAERVGIRTLAQTDPIAADFIATLDATIASGARVLANDPDLIAGLGYLQTQPAGSPVFTAGRVAELIAP